MILAHIHHITSQIGFHVLNPLLFSPFSSHFTGILVYIHNLIEISFHFFSFLSTLHFPNISHIHWPMQELKFQFSKKSKREKNVVSKRKNFYIIHIHFLITLFFLFYLSFVYVSCLIFEHISAPECHVSLWIFD